MPLATLSPEVARRTITLASAGKTFGFPGLPCGFVVFGDGVVHRRFADELCRRVGAPSRLAMEAASLAYRHGAAWLHRIHQELTANRERLRLFLSSHEGLLGGQPPEGTFLAWIDGRRVVEAKAQGMTLGEFFLKRARVGLSPGECFGAQGGAGYVRLNLGTSSEILAEIFARMGLALSRA